MLLCFIHWFVRMISLREILLIPPSLFKKIPRRVVPVKRSRRRRAQLLRRRRRLTPEKISWLPCSAFIMRWWGQQKKRLNWVKNGQRGRDLINHQNFQANANNKQWIQISNKNQRNQKQLSNKNQRNQKQQRIHSSRDCRKPKGLVFIRLWMGVAGPPSVLLAKFFP